MAYRQIKYRTVHNHLVKVARNKQGEIVSATVYTPVLPSKLTITRRALIQQTASVLGCSSRRVTATFEKPRMAR